MSKIGFNLSNEDRDTEEDVAIESLIDGTLLEGMLMEYFNPPAWDSDFQKTLFWATVFNTAHKVYEC
jgi:hypothetical protein